MQHNLPAIIFFTFCISIACVIGGVSIHSAMCGLAVWSGLITLTLLFS